MILWSLNTRLQKNARGLIITLLLAFPKTAGFAERQLGRKLPSSAKKIIGRIVQQGEKRNVKMLGGAVVSPLNSTLGDGYVPADPARLSPDRKVDLSGVLFPESTWAVRNLSHVGCSTGTDSSEFLFWLLGYDGKVTVNSNPKYPQFMYSTDGYTLEAQ